MDRLRVFIGVTGDIDSTYSPLKQWAFLSVVEWSKKRLYTSTARRIYNLILVSSDQLKALFLVKGT